VGVAVGRRSAARRGVRLPIFRRRLANALDYYQGYKYSETVEVAVVPWRLGYKVRNDVVVPVPIYRSRTSMVDVGIDLWSIPAAAIRVQRHRPAVPLVPVPGLAKPIAVTAALAVAGAGVPAPPGASSATHVAGLVEQLVEADRLQSGPEAIEDEGQG
jgi:hypothetical protein